jgi:ubiquinone/menaquinone biosynthesis C-methylase UbiE
MSNHNIDIYALNNEELRELDSQLRKPSGKRGIQVGERMSENNMNIYGLTIDEILKKEYKTALEPGFGTGKLINELLKVNAEIHVKGIDHSELMIEEASKLNREAIENGRTELSYGNISEIPFENNMFDLVYTVNTIYFWDHPETCFNEIRRVLKPGGTFINAMRTQEKMKNYPVGKNDFKHYSRNEVKKLFNLNGFKIKNEHYRLDGNVDMLCLNSSIN